MKLLAIAACAATITIYSCNSSGTSSTETTDSTSAMATTTASVDSGWTTLFDGTGTNGWHSYGKPGVNTRWKIADGALTIDTASKESGDIVTNDEYENFDLQLDWKIAPKGNSGIIFLVKEDTAKYHATYLTGPEMQVLDNNGHEDAKIPKHRAGDLYDLIACSTETVKPAGEWNQAEIKINKGKLDLFLNGTNVVSTTLWDDNWKKLVAGSKFKAMPDFASFKSGHIALQDHGNMVSYKNIRIKKL
jgi:Domain of Unknown Function (DUF1080)